MKLLFITTGILALHCVTGCGLQQSKNHAGGYCQETENGYKICINATDIKCEPKQRTVYPSTGPVTRIEVHCSAFGKKVSLTTGEESHWTTLNEEGGNSVACTIDNNPNTERTSFGKSLGLKPPYETFTCMAAKEHSKI